jgi:hypothetical protein
MPGPIDRDRIFGGQRTALARRSHEADWPAWPWMVSFALDGFEAVVAGGSARPVGFAVAVRELVRR